MKKLYGGGDFVRKSGFRRFSSVTNIHDLSGVGLKELNKINKRHINDKLIHIVSDVKVLILAYKIIKNKLENSTTLDNIDLKWFMKVSKELKAGKFKPARRFYISKPG